MKKAKEPYVLTSDNYFSKEANEKYLSVSQFKDFVGTMGYRGCEAAALAKLRGEYKDEMTTALLQGKYADAYFTGDLNKLKEEYPQMFSTRGATAGELKSEYKKVERTIERIEQDEYFMKTLSGEKQVLFTAELFGAQWKCLLDVYHPNTAIVDLKFMEDLKKRLYAKDYGYMIWLEYWGYDFQGAIYQKIVELNVGKKLPFYIAAGSKETTPDLEVIGIDDARLAQVLSEVENHIPRILSLKNGEIEPDRCGKCDWCKQTKKLTGPIHWTALSE